MNLKQSARKANLKKWKATGPAIIQSPLKQIHARYPDERDPVSKALSEHPIYAKARRMANAGNGSAVKAIARTL